LSHLFPRIAKAYALSRWPLDWIIGYVSPAGIKKGLAAGYGAKHTSPSVFYPDSVGEAVLLYTSAEEAAEDLIEFLDSKLPRVSDAAGVSPSFETTLAHEVTSTSPELVFHGSSSRS
jgi:hypothetical protein